MTVLPFTTAVNEETVGPKLARKVFEFAEAYPLFHDRQRADVIYLRLVYLLHRVKRNEPNEYIKFVLLFNKLDKEYQEERQLEEEHRNKAGA